MLQEDAATAEVSRSQLWQWCKHGITTAEGKKVDKGYAQKLLNEQADELSSKAPKGNKYHLAAQYFSSQVTGEEYAGKSHLIPSLCCSMLNRRQTS